jgi:hypothetical protein
MKKLPGKEVDTKQPSIVSSEIFGKGEVNDSKIVKDFLKSRIQEVIQEMKKGSNDDEAKKYMDIIRTKLVEDIQEDKELK